jgi:hypothetical protein
MKLMNNGIAHVGDKKLYFASCYNKSVKAVFSQSHRHTCSIAMTQQVEMTISIKQKTIKADAVFTTVSKHT